MSIQSEYTRLMSGILGDALKRDLRAKQVYLYSRDDLAALQALFADFDPLITAITASLSPAEGAVGKKMYARVRATARAVEVAAKTRKDYWDADAVSAGNDVIYHSTSMNEYIKLLKLYVERDSLPEGEDAYLESLVSDPETGAISEATS